jgi:hypothetical protein
MCYSWLHVDGVFACRWRGFTLLLCETMLQTHISCDKCGFTSNLFYNVTLSSNPQEKAKSVPCFHLSNGAFENKNSSWVLDLIGLMEGALLVWSKFAKGFCTGVLGRTV